MSAANIGPNIGLNGVDQYKQDLEMAKAATKAFKAELESFGKIKEPFAKAVGQTSALEKEIAAQQIAIKGLTEKYGEAVNKYGQYSKQAFKAQEELAKANKALSAMIDEYKGLSTTKITIPGVGEFKRDIETLTQSTKTFKSEFQAITSGFGIEGAFKRASDSSKSLNDAIKVQKETITVLKEEYDKTAAEQGEFSQGAMEMREKVANATVELNNMQRTLRELPNGFQVAGQEITNYGNNLKNIGNNISQAGRPLLGITTAYAAAVGASVKESMNFETAMVKATRTMADASGETEKAIENQQRLEEAARKTGRETIFTAEQAAGALESLGRAGFGTERSIASLPAVMDLAAADSIELADAASIVADNLNALGMGGTVEEATRLVDLLAQTSRSTNTDVTLMAESFKYAGSLFASVGWEAEDLALAVGMAADYGVKGSMAGTGLKQAMIQLIRPTDKASQLISQYGVGLDDGTGKSKEFSAWLTDLRSAFGGLNVEVFDANNQLKDGETIMQEYGESLPYDQMEKLDAVARIFGTRSLPAVLALINTTDKDLSELQVDIGNAAGTAREMAQAFEESTEGRWLLLKSAISDVALAMGETLLPIARDFLDTAKQWVDRFNAMDDGTKKFLLTAGGVVALIGPILTGIGGITSGVGTLISSGGHLLSGIGGIVKLIGGAGSGLIGGLSWLASGFGGIIAAAVPWIAIAAGIVAAGVLIWKNWDQIKATATELKEWATQKWTELKDNVSATVENMKTAVTEKWNAIRQSASDTWNNIKQGVTDKVNALKNSISSAFENIKTKISNAFMSAKTAAQNAFTNIKNLGNDIKTTISGIIDSALNWGKDIIGNIASGIRQKISDVQSAITSVADTIRSYIHFTVPDKGPLKDADTYMPDFMRLLASGMRNGSSMLRAASDHVASVIAPDFYAELPEGAGSNTTTNMGGVNIVINAQPGQDVYELADLVEERISSLMERREAAYA